MPATLIHGSMLWIIVLVLISAGQPIFTDDSWWHLAMGAEYARSGPWLSADPFLFAAAGPPAPAAWLIDQTLHYVHHIAGFQGLRVSHVVVVASILALAWSMLRRASGSLIYASLGTTLFAMLSAYRFFQLRPHLFSILFALLLIRILVSDREAPSAHRIAAAVGLTAIWANSHGAFVLGLVLLSAAVAGAATETVLRSGEAGRGWLRTRGLLVALVFCVLGSLINPLGIETHLLYFTAGADTPELAIVADEWAPLALLERPRPNVPPSPLNWLLVWGLVIATPLAAIRAVAGARRNPADVEAARINLIWVALALVSLLGMVSAVRLLWLGIFPLLLLGESLRTSPTWASAPNRRLTPWVAVAVLAVLLVPSFVMWGDWPMISRAIHPGWYGRPYLSTKRNAHAVWFLRDTELEGRVANDYSSGNFLSYWVTPRMQIFINGSLNVPNRVLDANRAITTRRGLVSGESFENLLDQYDIDVFFGVGAPRLTRPGRTMPYTTTHLEHTPGWILVFRNMQSAIYLRDSPRDRTNLMRISEYYQEAGVPFDPERGFEPHRVMRESLAWAVDHGLLPVDIERTEVAARSMDRGVRMRAQDRLAAIYAVTGVYDRAIEIDRGLLHRNPNAIRSARRLVWSLLHARRLQEAGEAADRLEAITAPGDGLSLQLIAAARVAPSSSEAEIAATVAMLPVLERPEGHRLFAGYLEPEERPGRNPPGPG